MTNSIWEFSMSFRLLLSLAVAAVVTGCDRFLRSEGANSQKDRVLLDVGKDYHCLQEWPEQARAYVSDQLEKEKIPAMFQCVRDSLVSFQGVTKLSGGNYTAKDLQYYLNRYLFRNNQINDAFMKELMRLKVLLLGGGLDSLTRSEILEIQNLLEVMLPEAVSLAGSWRMISFAADITQAQSISEAQLQEVRSRVEQALNKLLVRSKIAESNYEWDDFVKLHQELIQFMGPTESGAQIQRWLPLAEKIKILFIGESAELGRRQDWSRHLQWSVGTWFLALRYHYWIRPASYNEPTVWQRLIDFWDLALVQMEQSPRMAQATFLKAQDMDNVLTEMNQLGLIDQRLSLPLAKDFLRKVLVHLLDRVSSDRAESFEARGIELRHLNILRFEYEAWRLVQSAIVKTFQGRDKAENMQFQEFVISQERVVATELAASGKLGGVQDEALRQTWAEWVSLLKNKPPVVFGEDLLLQVRGNLETSAVGFRGLSMMNLVRTITRLTLRGYGDNRDRNLWNTQITQRRINDLEQDFRQFGRALGMLDPRSLQPARDTFLQSNWFTYSGNGDESMDARELHHLVALMMSGGRKAVSLAWEDLEAKGALLSSKDALGRPMASLQVFSDKWLEVLDRAIQGMPEFKTYVRSLPPERQSRFLQGLLRAVRMKESLPNEIEALEVRNLIMTLHYMESLVLVYDRNRDGLFSKDELLAAYPRFEPWLKSKYNDYREWFLKPGFLFLFAYGRVPGVSDLPRMYVNQAKFAPVDRAALLTVFLVLTQKDSASQRSQVDPNPKPL